MIKALVVEKKGSTLQNVQFYDNILFICDFPRKKLQVLVQKSQLYLKKKKAIKNVIDMEINVHVFTMTGCSN